MTRDEARKIAIKAAAEAAERPHYFTPGQFVPHEWVVDAVLAGYAAASEQATFEPE